MSEHCILGIDPGLSGAIAFFFPSHAELIAAEDVPIADGEIDAATLSARIEQMRPTFAIIERVASMPRQGVSSTFKFGAAYGVVRGIVGSLKIPSHLVTPTKWKRHFNLSSDKEESRALALRLWPARAELFSRKKDHGHAEAALLARYGAEVIVGARS